MTYSGVDGGVLLALSVVWYLSVVRLAISRRTSPLRPAIVVVLCAAFLVDLARRLEGSAAAGSIDPLCWLHVANLVVVFLDLRMTAPRARGDHRLRESHDLVAALPRPRIFGGSRAA